MSEPRSITWTSLWRIFFMLVLVAVLFVARDVFIALFLAIVIASALDRPVTFLEKRRVPRILGTLILYIILIAALSLLVYSVVPALITEFSVALINLRDIPLAGFDTVDIRNIIQQINDNIGQVTQFFFGGAASILDISSRFLGGIIFAGSVFVFSFYLTVGRDGVEKFFITILPDAYENRVLELFKKVRKKIGRWLQGQLILSAIVGSAVFVGLELLGVPYSLVLGVLAAFMELIPFVGPIFSGAIAVIVGLTVSLKLALYILILFIIIQQLENHFLVPSVLSMTTALNPVVILVSILIGAKIFGFIGVVLAVPAAVLVQELVEDWSRERHRGRSHS